MSHFFGVQGFAFRSCFLEACISRCRLWGVGLLSGFWGLLGGSWVVLSGVISTVTIVITHIRGLITPLITTHEPPSRGCVYGLGGEGDGETPSPRPEMLQRV